MFLSVTAIALLTKEHLFSSSVLSVGRLTDGRLWNNEKKSDKVESYVHHS